MMPAPPSDLGPKFSGPASESGTSPVHCHLIVDVDGRQRLYAENIRMRLSSNGLVAELMPLRGGGMDMNAVLSSAVQDAVRQRALFACIINEQNEMHRSITVNILHGQLQEHRNMPLESAMSLILRNFEEWLTNNGDVATEPRQTGHQAPSLDFQRPDDNVVRMLRMAIDGRCLVVEELDEVIGYFQQRRDAMAKAQGIAPASKSASSGILAGNEGERGQRELPDQVLQLMEKDPSLATAAKTAQASAATSDFRRPSRFADAPPAAREMSDKRPGGFPDAAPRPPGPAGNRGSFHGYGQGSNSASLAQSMIGDFSGLQDKMQSLYPGSQPSSGAGMETHPTVTSSFSQPPPGGMSTYARPPTSSVPPAGFGMSGPHWAGAASLGASNGRQDWRPGFNRPDYHNPMQYQQQRIAGSWQADSMPFGRFH